jgi:hypothetical protein
MEFDRAAVIAVFVFQVDGAPGVIWSLRDCVTFDEVHPPQQYARAEIATPDDR